MTSDALSSAQDRMAKAVENLVKEFHTIRTGRANPSIFDKVEVEYYGTPTPLRSLANISTSDGRSLAIQPYDKSCLKDIETAIHKSGLGLTPNSDGNIIRINVPALTEERRKELIKVTRKYAEDGRVAIRNIRRDAGDHLKKMKGSDVSEDEIKRQEEALQKLTDKFVKEIDKLTNDKEAELTAV